MPTFKPFFMLWPRPQFLGTSRNSLFAWLDRREHQMEETVDTRPTASIRQIIEDYHDRHARTIRTVRTPDA